VSAATTERIHRIAAELGYRVRPMLRPELPATAAVSTSVIALLVADLTNPFYDEIINGAEDVADDAGFTLLVADTRSSAAMERSVLDRVLPFVDGLLLATPLMSDSAIRTIAAQRPVVVLNRVVGAVPSIVNNNPFGMRRVVEHLVELGHHSITYAAGPEASWTDGMRWRPLREMARELQLRTHRIGPFAPTVAGGVSAAAELARHGDGAVIAFNDRMAIGIVRELTARRIPVPAAVSVVGFDNIFAGEVLVPSLTTVAAPRVVMGRTGVAQLLAVISGSVPPPDPVTVLPTRLIVRDSTARRRTRTPATQDH
jgi:LacI family transcriptional regulator